MECYAVIGKNENLGEEQYQMWMEKSQDVVRGCDALLCVLKEREMGM